MEGGFKWLLNGAGKNMNKMDGIVVVHSERWERHFIYTTVFYSKRKVMGIFFFKWREIWSGHINGPASNQVSNNMKLTCKPNISLTNEEISLDHNTGWLEGAIQFNIVFENFGYKFSHTNTLFSQFFQKEVFIGK